VVEQQMATTRELAANVRAVSSATDQTARAMQDVAGVADKAGGVGYEVQDAADGIGRESERLLSEVDDFLVAIRSGSGERRSYERIPGDGASVTLRVAGQPATRATLRDLSRGGVAVLSDLDLSRRASPDAAPGFWPWLSTRTPKPWCGLIARSMP
jgi:methyl-accepting chemotaxis protein